MKLNLAVWSDGQRIYDVPDSRKYIRINHDPRTNEIFNVSLVEVVNGERRYQQFDAIGLLYLENICHGENNEELDTTLLHLSEKCFTEEPEYYEA